MEPKILTGHKITIFAPGLLRNRPVTLPHSLLTFKPDFELTNCRSVVWIVVKGFVVHDPRSPEKLAPVFSTARNR